MWLQDQYFHLHSLSKEVMEGTQAIFSRDMAFTVAKLVPHTLVSAELVAIKLLHKVTKTANMVVATKLSEATTMATLNNVVVVDGVATTDTDGSTTSSCTSLVECRPPLRKLFTKSVLLLNSIFFCTHLMREYGLLGKGEEI